MSRESSAGPSTPTRPAAVIVQQGKVLDYIDEVTQRKETPEEYVRQEIAKSLVREYGYAKEEISVEFSLRLGSRRPRADLLIFGEADAHDQDRARIIVECKSKKIKPTSKKDGVGQLHSYMAACPNVSHGMWTNGIERFCDRRVDDNGNIRFEEVPDVPTKGRSEDEAERPRFDQEKATLAHSTTQDVLVSHDLLRIDPIRKDWRGWVYAYLRAPTVRKMMKAAQYGHIIKHLETHHLDSLPQIHANELSRGEFDLLATDVLKKRDRAYTLTLEAEQLFTQAFGNFRSRDGGEEGFTVRAAGLCGYRCRLDAWHHVPSVKALVKHLGIHATDWSTIDDLGFDVWVPKRFRRIAAPDGPYLLDNSDLFAINPDIKKRIADRGFGDPYNMRVKREWILMAYSGQIYGLNGSATISGPFHESKVISNHVIRIAPNSPKCRLGYLLIALTHPELGRPRVKALPHGSNVPEIEVYDLQRLCIPRLDHGTEAEIADRAEEAARLRDRADELEREIGKLAELEINRFLHPGDLSARVEDASPPYSWTQRAK